MAKKKYSDAIYRAVAQEMYNKEGECEIDNLAPISSGGDPGVYVQAWVWVSNEDVKAIKEKK